MANRPIHFEIHAENPIRAAGFYAGVFGWKFTKWAGPWPYWSISTGEGTGVDGGLLQRMGDPPVDGQPVNGWVMTVGAASLDETGEAISRHGGRQALPKMAVPGIGWLGYFKDTEGNIFGVMQDDAGAK